MRKPNKLNKTPRRCPKCQRPMPARSFRKLCASDIKRERGMIPVQIREKTADGVRIIRTWEMPPAVIVAAEMMRDLARAANNVINQSLGVVEPGALKLAPGR